MTPQGLLIGLFLVELLGTAYLHGEPKKGNYNIAVKIIDILILWVILDWGGFWK